MKIEQLSSKDQKRVSDALAKCAAATKDIEDQQQLNDAAYGIFKDSLGDNPGLFKVACRVYNSCKSIHKLSAAGDDDRGNSFALLDANGLTDRLNKEASIAIYKQASAPVVFSTLPKIDKTEPMRKVASSVTANKPILAVEKLDGAARKSAINQIIRDWEDLVKEASSELSAASRELSSCMSDFVTALLQVPSNLRKTAAAEVYANYGSDADLAIRRFNEMRPMHKIASADYVGKYKGTPLISAKAVELASSKLFEANDELVVKKAYMDKVASECVAAMRTLFTGMRKSAASDGLAGKALTAAIGADVVSGLPELLGYDYTEEKGRSALADTEVENAILAAGSRRAFMKSLHNDTIASYPLPKIVEAFNLAYSKLPPSVRRMPATRSQALINAEMIATLAEGNTPSKADREHLLSIMKQFDYKTPVGLSEGLVS